MKLKNFTEEELDDLACIIDNEGFWYSLTDGGYINPENLLEDGKDVEKVLKAIRTIREFESLLPTL